MEAAREDGRLLGHGWMRCSAYVIEGGMIRPAPGANVERYNPGQASREAASEEARPYKRLLRLAQRVDMGRLSELGKRQRKELERWLAENGLLGILPHETLGSCSWPHWRERSAVFQPAGGPTYYVPEQRCVRRSASGWTTELSKVGREKPAEAITPGAPVEPELLDDSTQPVETTFRTWPKGEIRRAALGARWRSYFPHLGALEAERHDYPGFADEEFWLSYGEPLEAFLRWPRQLASALAYLADGRYGEEQWRKESAMMALAEIDDAAFGARRGGYLREDGSIALGQAAPSLISCFAMMILEDLADGQQIMHCPICGGYFLSAAYQARFCSSACRFTHHKRQQRAVAESSNSEEQTPDCIPDREQQS